MQLDACRKRDNDQALLNPVADCHERGRQSAVTETDGRR